jgi:hypothetical protein
MKFAIAALKDKGLEDGAPTVRPFVPTEKFSMTSTE